MTEKHLLLAVSDNSSMAGIYFIDSFFRHRKSLLITLLYLAPASPEGDGPSSEAWLSPEEKQRLRTSARMEKTLAECRTLLCGFGVPEKNIKVLVTSRQQSKVKDIIREGHGGCYDGVVLGRRTISRLEKFLDESVSDEMLRQRFDFPLWVCRNPERGRKNILLCLDGSESALRVADHVGFMIGREEPHRITLFHVDHGRRGDLQHFFDAARNCLREYDVPAAHIETKTVHALRVGRAIRREIDEGKYAVVAVGLLGRHHEGLKDWIVGSKSLDLVNDLEKAVLWGCR